MTWGASGPQDRLGLQAGLGDGLEQQVVYLGGVYMAKVPAHPPFPSLVNLVPARVGVSDDSPSHGVLYSITLDSLRRVIPACSPLCRTLSGVSGAELCF